MELSEGQAAYSKGAQKLILSFLASTKLADYGKKLCEMEKNYVKWKIYFCP